jgi:hypothetical protein
MPECPCTKPDHWVIDHTAAPAIPSDGVLEVTITDFGGQVRGNGMFSDDTLDLQHVHKGSTAQLPCV